MILCRYSNSFLSSENESSPAPKKAAPKKRKKRADENQEAAAEVPESTLFKDDEMVQENVNTFQSVSVMPIEIRNSNMNQSDGQQEMNAGEQEDDQFNSYNNDNRIKNNDHNNGDNNDHNNDHNDGDNDGEEYDENESSDDVHLAANQLLVTLSYSLTSQVRQMARMEGVNPEDIIIELIAEGVTKRAFDDASRPVPSHLMTRTGYVPPEANGNLIQPTMSHHTGPMANNRPQNNNNQRRYNNTNPNSNNGAQYNNNNGGQYNNNRNFNNNPQNRYNNNGPRQNNMNGNMGGGAPRPQYPNQQNFRNNNNNTNYQRNNYQRPQGPNPIQPPGLAQPQNVQNDMGTEGDDTRGYNRKNIRK